MRHFLTAKLVLAGSIAGLTGRLQASSSELDSVPAAGAANRISAALEAAALTEPLPPITTVAEPKLDSAKRANDEPIAFQRHGAPGRQFLDMELRLW
jgi:hypothetical protein